MENLSLSFSSSSSSKNLLHRFMGSAGDLELKSDENEDVELNLGLSLGGRFGVDRTTTKITRSSSIATYLPVASDDCIEPGGSLPAPVTPPAPPYTGLARSSSLPVESEVDYRKRKELQSLRRMEAKRRRCEKQRNLRGEIATSVEEKKEAEASPQGNLEREKSLPAGMRRPPGLMRAGSISSLMAKVRELGCLGGQGSNLESIDLESTEAKQGSSGEPSLGNNSIQSLTEGSNQEIGSTSARPARPNLEGPPRTPRKQGGLETGTVALEDMPCVFTNPNGRRVDGILYKYVRGEEVRILCVCHGNFHSPSGFVKHAGGPDVDNPLRLITVNNHVPPLV